MGVRLPYRRSGHVVGQGPHPPLLRSQSAVREIVPQIFFWPVGFANEGPFPRRCRGCADHVRGPDSAAAAGIKAPIGCHSFRATGITVYLENGGTLEHARAMVANESPRTTKLYDRTKERLTLEEIERIRL
jgi:hypothetical protein